VTRNEILSFLTPPTLPENRECRSLSIPASQEWLGNVNAALLLLANPDLWEQLNDTDLTAEEAAAAAEAMYAEYLGSGYLGECGMTRQSTYQRQLDASESLGNCAAHTAYVLLFPVPVDLEAPVAISDDNDYFNLSPGRWHISAQSQVNGNASELQLWDYTLSVEMVAGVFQWGGLATLDLNLTLPENYSVQVKQWFRSAVINGRGLADSTKGCVVHNIVFTWRPLL
jgi:hypothetical protein